jgi:tetratricopeptide (TPR) repeat protein
MDSSETGPLIMNEMERFEHLKALWQLDPRNSRLERECIDAALGAGQYAFVLSHTQSVPGSSPGDVRTLFDRGTALIGMREYRAAIDAFSGVLQQRPDISAAGLNLGLCHYCLAEYSEAKRALEPLYASGDRSAGLLRLLVSACHHLGLMDEAVALCEANPAPAREDSALAGVYALVYLDTDRAEPAGSWAATALARDPRCVDALIVEGSLSIISTDLARAKERFDSALALAPATARAWIGLGTLALLGRDLSGAREQLARGVELMPGHVGSWHILAWTHLLAGDLAAAEAALRRALELDRNFAETHGGLASVAALRGDRQEASRLIEIALRLDPRCLSAQFARSVLLGLMGNPAAARHLIRRTGAALAAQNGSVLGRVIEHATRQ